MSEFIEYNCDTNPYPSFGKKYNGEKAIISMTSWKMRIATCSKTIYSLLKQCPGFHIVLVLSEEEFPKMMNELPDNLKLFAENELIEVLWVYKNYKSFKKVLFTMDKYRDVPVISADDDCIYTCNYAQELYDKWKQTNKAGSYYVNNTWGSGYGALFTPYVFDDIGINKLTQNILLTDNDDVLYYQIIKKINGVRIYCKNIKKPIFHDSIEPLSGSWSLKKNAEAHDVVSFVLNADNEEFS